LPAFARVFELSLKKYFFVVSVFFPAVLDKKREVLEVKHNWLHGLVATAAFRLAIAPEFETSSG
jgi:hypothetical protein